MVTLLWSPSWTIARCDWQGWSIMWPYGPVNHPAHHVQNPKCSYASRCPIERTQASVNILRSAANLCVHWEMVRMLGRVPRPVLAVLSGTLFVSFPKLVEIPQKLTGRLNIKGVKTEGVDAEIKRWTALPFWRGESAILLGKKANKIKYFFSSKNITIFI